MDIPRKDVIQQPSYQEIEEQIMARQLALKDADKKQGDLLIKEILSKLEKIENDQKMVTQQFENLNTER